MQTELMHIQPFIQAYVLAIASILEAAVTVVDRRLMRVAGTGLYAEQSGARISHTAFFRHILETGTPGLIRDVRQSSVCADCEQQGACLELADMAYPIFMDGQVVGHR